MMSHPWNVVEMRETGDGNKNPFGSIRSYRLNRFPRLREGLRFWIEFWSLSVLALVLSVTLLDTREPAVNAMYKMTARMARDTMACSAPMLLELYELRWVLFASLYSWM